jgi:hypothetical protein
MFRLNLHVSFDDLLVLKIATLVYAETPHDWVTDADHDAIVQCLDATSGWSPLKVGCYFIYAIRAPTYLMHYFVCIHLGCFGGNVYA